MATIAPPGKYALPDTVLLSATASFTGRSMTIPLHSVLIRQMYRRYGFLTTGPAIGASPRAGSFGQRRGRRFANRVSL
jgi:hypothetical protein